jgi:TldD protein
MFPFMRSILSKTDSDYSDVRYEMKRETIITFNGRELTQISSNSTDGYVLRALKRGGLSSVAFTREADADRALRTVEENALLIAQHIREPVRFAKTEILRKTVQPSVEEDPRRVSMDEKLELTRGYNSIPLGHEGIVTTITGYSEVIREKYFLNTEGAEIREDLVTTRLSSSITSKDGTLIQNVRLGLGGSQGFRNLRNQEGEFEKKTSICLDLLKAEPVQGRRVNVVLNPSLAGVFTHEAFGHFSEADLIEDSPTLRDKMRIGEKFGNDGLNIIDDPTLPGQLGFYQYDDEGVAARPTRLMEKGVLAGRLHSRRTAAAFGEPLTGHCVAEDYRYAPIIRMGNIFIEPGPHTFDDLLERLGDGLYLLDSMGGETSGENFTFGAQYGYEVVGGRLGKMIRDINISGNLFQTLKNIGAVGNDLVLSKVGGCGKGQLNIRSCNGGPHILVHDVVVGGR